MPGTVWELEPQTKAKHELLRRYLGAWFPILTTGGFNRRVVFLDGFAGPGNYKSGEPGSPIIAIDTLVKHKVFKDFDHTEFVFIFIEPDGERFASLEAELTKYWAARSGGQPENVKVQTQNDTFEAVASHIVDYMREQKKHLAPTLAFVDPFGWKGVPLALIADLLSSIAARCSSTSCTTA